MFFKRTIQQKDPALPITHVLIWEGWRGRPLSKTVKGVDENEMIGQGRLAYNNKTTVRLLIQHLSTVHASLKISKFFSRKVFDWMLDKNWLSAV